jgi:hypothetical protein
VLLPSRGLARVGDATRGPDRGSPLPASFWYLQAHERQKETKVARRKGKGGSGVGWGGGKVGRNLQEGGLKASRRCRLASGACRGKGGREGARLK